MDIIIALIIIALFLAAASADHNKNRASSGGPSVSMNEIVYPADIHCEHCDGEVGIMGNVDSSTWDLNCPHCKEIAYKHPKRDERQQQIEDLLS